MLVEALAPRPSQMRSMSAWAPEQTLNSSCRALMFIGMAERRLAKPECISPLTDRQCARAARSLGSRPASGKRLGEVLADGERVPDLDAVDDEARHEERRRHQQQLVTLRRVVRARAVLVEVEAREPAHQPAAQGPRAVVLLLIVSVAFGIVTTSAYGSKSPKQQGFARSSHGNSTSALP